MEVFWVCPTARRPQGSQNTLERLNVESVSGVHPPGGAGKCCWREGYLIVLCSTCCFFLVDYIYIYNLYNSDMMAYINTSTQGKERY